ncbi:3-dehydroquinate dehydratase (3-dehydroquinase) [Rhizoclosmatium sp. JEL0117]|nr:3-dehydroquinate dehydratase (3-dehydroquinase) [Rhizoclosmatium sp. JEL0117]
MEPESSPRRTTRSSARPAASPAPTSPPKRSPSTASPSKAKRVRVAELEGRGPVKAAFTTDYSIAGAAHPIHRVSVLGAESVTLGFGITSHIAKQIAAKAPASTYLVATDSNVAPLHLPALKEALRAHVAEGSRILEYIIPPGESVKTREMKNVIEDFMLANKCTRDSCIIALGGGVVGDMFGFVAATFMRGIPVIQIPTTLLAMVDSSIGGKTAVDTPHGKNLIGAFHQPRHIFMDLAYLRTLPHREYINGMAEVIKTAAIWDEEDFALLENNAEDILNLSAANKKADSELNTDLLLKVVLGSIRVKAHIVTVDEKETGLRGLLNYGHTVGHAIEAILSPELLHGECVAMGMVREAEIARHLGYVNDVVIGRIVRCLQAYGLPVSTEDKKVLQLAPGKHCSVDQMMDIMRVDKKNQGNKKRVVMLAGIGKTHEPKASFIPDDVIIKVLSPAMVVDGGLKADSARKEVRLNVPGSKSISNRALVLAALGKGECRLEGLLHSDDVQVMLDSLQKLVGIKYTWEDNGNTLSVEGGAGKLQVPNSEIYLGNAGTAARFLTTVCCLVRSSDGRTTTVTGNARMKQRPIGPLVEALRSNGCDLTYLEGQGCLPLKVEPTGLKGGHIKLSASISSQYVSSILLSAPYAETAVTLELIGDAVVSKPYIDMTTAMMKSFGIVVTVDPGNDNIYHIPKGVYKNPKTYLVEADASSATYPLAFAAITGTKVTVTNIGSNSLQGDAEFAVKVLRPMGCIVEQTATQTTVQGPKRLKPIPSIDMETMTDAFLTASVLAAVATNGESGPDANLTKIHGISNQRVKECNRIAAMVEQLAKFGVHASELPDGIQISGVNEDPKKALKSPEGGVFCYDDHRVAMSFSILACARGAGQKSIILEKKCVEKTWPAWWDALENILGISVTGADLVHDGSSSAGNKQVGGKAASAAPATSTVTKNIPVKPAFDETTVVVIGMRGAGKSHMGKAAAKALNRTFIDTDDYFAHKMGITIAEYVKDHSWAEFRKLECAQLQQILNDHPKGYVVSCGGGIVETPEARVVLKDWHSKKGRVIHLTRDIGAVVEYLTADKTRPALGEDPKSIWSRRRPWYKECSNAEFKIVADGSDASWKAVERDFAKYMRFMLSTEGTFQVAGSPSFFLCLTFGDLHDAVKVLENASEGADALELRVDLLKEWSDEFIGTQISLIRRHSDLPIIFTVRTKSQGGRFADNDLVNMFSLLELGVKYQCEFVDVEVLDAKSEQFLELYKALSANKGRSHFLASFHDFSGTAIWDQTGYGSSLSAASGSRVMMRDKYVELHQFGDSIKLIGKANTLDDNFALHRFVHETVPTLGLQPVKPLIAVNMTAVGQVSRALNDYMTPVTHPALPIAAAPGQLSIKQIHETRYLLGLIAPKKFYLFGHPIAQSMSPTLHNAGFNVLGLPHKYSLSENPNWSHVKAMLDEGLKNKTFGGASVTIPHKEEIIKHNLVSTLTEAATKIGAVNTIMIDDHGKLVGDNTDWLGIRASILKRVSIEGYDLVGGVIGAGGTSRAACFALKSLGVTDLRIWNRTESKAAGLAEEFGGHVVSGGFEHIFDKSPAVGAKPKLFLLVSSVPGASQNDLPIDEMFTNANAGAPAGSVGVFVEMAYRPRQTVIIEHLGSIERTNISWSYVEGVEILIEQGLEQFTRWTGRRAPRKVIEETVYANYK